MSISTPNSMRTIFATAIAFLIMMFASTQLGFASEQLVKKYQELAEKAGFTFTYGSLETHSIDTFTLHDITLIRHGVEDPLKVKSIKLTGVNELSGIGLSAKNLSLTALSWDGRDKDRREVVVSLGNASVDGFYMPDPNDLDAQMFIFDEYVSSMENLSVLINGDLVLEIPSATSEFSGNGAANIFDGFLKISNLTVHPENIDDGGRMKQQLAVLGYDTLIMDINLEADWNMKTGRLALNKYEFDLADMGAFNVQLAVGGYTEELAKKMRTISAEIQALPVEERDQASQRVLGELSVLTMEKLSLSFRDASITQKILDVQAQAQGQSADNLKAMLPIMLNGVLARLQQPDLAAKLVSAVEAFLADPGTIALSAIPQSPLTFAEIAGLGMALPGILIEKLNITAEAK